MAVQFGRAVSRSVINRALANQAEHMPEAAEHCGVCGGSVQAGPPPEPRALTTSVGAVSWSAPKRYCPKCRAAFFPRAQALGIDHGCHSPHVLRMILYAGVQNTSFAAGRAALLNLARLDVAEKQVERVTERIGQERVDQRRGAVQAFLELPFMEKFASPAAQALDLAVVSMDGGRLQIRGQPSGAAAEDAVADPNGPEEEGLPGRPRYTPPKVKVKSMVATRQPVETFGPILAAAARARGSCGARRKAFVSDGADANRGVQRRWFSDFVAILDFIHALSYVFAAAMAGRGFAAG